MLLCFSISCRRSPEAVQLAVSASEIGEDFGFGGVGFGEMGAALGEHVGDVVDLDGVGRGFEQRSDGVGGLAGLAERDLGVGGDDAQFGEVVAGGLEAIDGGRSLPSVLRRATWCR